MSLRKKRDEIVKITDFYSNFFDEIDENTSQRQSKIRFCWLFYQNMIRIANDLGYQPSTSLLIKITKINVTPQAILQAPMRV